MPSFAERLAAICREERARFAPAGPDTPNNPVETRDPFFRFVKEYWSSIGLPYDGRTIVNNIRPAWSSAFVSFCVRKAGAGEAFRYGQAHCHYIERAMKAADDADASYGYWARRFENHPIKVGDIVTAGREYAKRYNYDEARLVYAADSFYPSHGDIVVEIDMANSRAITIGGNLGNSVETRRVPLNPNGTLKPRMVNGTPAPWIAVLECRLT